MSSEVWSCLQRDYYGEAATQHKKCCRSIQFRSPHLAQLPVVVVPEALHGAVRKKAARVGAPGRHRRRGEASAEVYLGQGIAELAWQSATRLRVPEAELSVVVLPEALEYHRNK